MHARARHPWTALALAALGCPTSEGSDDGCERAACSTTDGGTTTAESSSSDAGETAASSDDGDASSSGTAPPACGDPTAALALRDVSLFQTIEVPLVRDCVPIDPDQRTAPIVAGHVAMVRARLTLGAQWAGDDLVAHADVESAAGDERFTGTCTTIAAGDGTADLHVEIPAASIRADTRVSVTVAACEGGILAVLPDDGTVELGAETTGVLRLHLVPFEVGGFVPDTSPAVLEGFRDALLAHYPVTDVEITVGPVEPDDAEGQVDMNALMARLIALQESEVFATGRIDPAKAGIYYYGLVSGAPTREEFCDACPTGTSESGVGDRAGCAIGAAFGDALSESTLVHEMGHLHGLLHSPCGEPSLQDPEFPYADGATHTEGWDFRTGELVPATHNDLMGYCQPRWVSDFNFRKLVDWVQLASSWSTGARAFVRGPTRTRCTSPAEMVRRDPRVHERVGPRDRATVFTGRAGDDHQR